MKNKSDKTTPPQKASKTKALLLWLFNPRVWGDWDRSKAISLFFLGMIERFFVLRGKPKRKSESFDRAIAKFDLDEKTLQEKSSGLKRLRYSLLGVALFLFLYCLYQFCYGSLKGTMIALVEVGIALVLAFRYHFWHFQIEQRKLGCSVKEWFKHSFKGERS